MIGFAGLSHLGIVSSIAAAVKGNDIVAFDPDPQLCARMEQGKLPIVEPGLPELLAEAGPRIRFTSDAGALSACDLIYISPDVATGPRNQVILEPLHQLIETVAAVASANAVIVVLSQVPPGFTRRLTFEESNRPAALFYQVETLIFGNAVHRALHPERFIIGCLDAEKPLPDCLDQFLGSFDCPILPMRYESAELAKISINMCLVASISAANTLAEVCEAIGADWNEIVPALRLDKRIGQHAYISPGLGLAGGNLERDLATICDVAGEHGADAGVVSAWIANSLHRRNWVLRVLHTEIADWTKPPTIALWGLAYKAGTASTKNAVALDLLNDLRGVPVRVYDPEVTLDATEWPGVTQCSSVIEACTGADALAIMTPWPEFAEIDMAAARAAMRGSLVIDPFAAIVPVAGIRYRRLGAFASKGSIS